MQGGKRLRRTDSAGAPLDVTSTRFPWAKYEQTMLAMACVLPHPGGPSTTTAGAPSDNNWWIRSCEADDGRGKRGRSGVAIDDQPNNDLKDDVTRWDSVGCWVIFTPCRALGPCVRDKDAIGGV